MLKINESKIKRDPVAPTPPTPSFSSINGRSNRMSEELPFITNDPYQLELLRKIQTHLKIGELTQKLQTLNEELYLKQKALNENFYTATIIEQSRFPPRTLNLPKNIMIDWICHPSGLIGGDICSVTPIENSQLVIAYILDVSGHGVSSAMMTVSLRQYLQPRQILENLSPPKLILTDLNREYPYEKFSMFSTIFYMILNAQNGHLVYSNAGHPPGVYLSPHHPFKLLNPTGPMVGVDFASTFDEQEERLQSGDKLFLYTDGITDYRNDKGEFYGSERLFALLEQNKLQPVNKIIQLLKESMREFGKDTLPLDDISILGVEFKSINKESD